jgi:general secretion pathway protein K
MTTKRHNSESGVVLIAVLGGILLLTMIVFALSSSVRVGAEELQNRKEQLQAYYLARGGVFTSSWLLSQMSTAPDSVVHPGQQFIEWELANGKVHVDLTDESGKIDINRAEQPLLEKLLVALGYELDTARPLATAIVDWRNPSSLARWESAQASGNLLDYEPTRSTQYSYHAVEEILNVPGIKPEIVYGHYVRAKDGKVERLPGLIDCVTVDSGTVRININYAPYPVLVAVTDMNSRTADYIVAGRAMKPFATVDEVTREFPASLSGETLSALTTQSSGNFTLLVSGQTRTGIVARIRAVVKVQGVVSGPFQILRWKDSHVQ